MDARFEGGNTYVPLATHPLALRKYQDLVTGKHGSPDLGLD